MAKNKANRKQELADFSFEVEEPVYGEEMGLEMLGLMVQSSHNQMCIAIELTKVIVDKNSTNSTDQVLETFLEALRAVNVNSPLKQMWEMVNK